MLITPAVLVNKIKNLKDNKSSGIYGLKMYYDLELTYYLKYLFGMTDNRFFTLLYIIIHLRLW